MWNKFVVSTSYMRIVQSDPFNLKFNFKPSFNLKFNFKPSFNLKFNSKSQFQLQYIPNLSVKIVAIKVQVQIEFWSEINSFENTK